MLNICHSANIISKSLHTLLQEKLKRRNIAAHPSGIKVSKLMAEESIISLIENVVLVLPS